MFDNLCFIFGREKIDVYCFTSQSLMIRRPIKIANEMTFVVFSHKLILNFSPLDLLDCLVYDSISSVFQPNVISSVISGRTKLDRLRKHRTIEAFCIFNQHATCPVAITLWMKRFTLLTEHLYMLWLL